MIKGKYGIFSNKQITLPSTVFLTCSKLRQLLFGTSKAEQA